MAHRKLKPNQVFYALFTLNVGCPNPITHFSDTLLSSTFNGGYLPTVGNSYQVMSYGSAAENFTATNLSPFAVWQVIPGATSLSIQVLKLVPQMTWPAPADIVYGTALSSTQIDATATWNSSPVPGTFTYTPPAGTVLYSGSNQTLSVTFTPTDSSTYTNITKTVMINVQKAPLTVTANSPTKSYGQTITFAGTEFTPQRPGQRRHRDEARP